MEFSFLSEYVLLWIPNVVYLERSRKAGMTSILVYKLVTIYNKKIKRFKPKKNRFS